MNSLSSKTFCAAAWFGARNDNLGKLDVCCKIDTSLSKFKGKINYTLEKDEFNEWLDSDYLQYLREELDNNKIPNECFLCKDAEKNGLESLRQTSNVSIANTKNYTNSWLSPYFKNKNDYFTDTIVSVDVMVSNLCNFECAMCFPVDSSRIHSTWKKDQSSEIVKQVLKDNPLYLDNITTLVKNNKAIEHFHKIIHNYPITFLHIRGGEPLLDENLLTLLEDIPVNKKKKIRLFFNTNGSINLVDIVNRFLDFKNVIMAISIDAINDHGNYVRKHSNWKKIKENVLSLKKYSNAIIRVHCTVHALNIMWVRDLEDWCDSNNLKLTFEFVYSPGYLSLSALSPNTLQNAKKSIKSQEVRNQINDIVYSNELHSQLLKYVEWYDKTSKVKFKDLPNKKGDL
jgi:MoaA/NifB/PqqE/SkfB family radical SAM enzyme